VLHHFALLCWHYAESPIDQSSIDWCRMKVAKAKKQASEQMTNNDAIKCLECAERNLIECERLQSVGSDQVSI
jgi:hypothetical protein